MIEFVIAYGIVAGVIAIAKVCHNVAMGSHNPYTLEPVRVGADRTKFLDMTIAEAAGRAFNTRTIPPSQIYPVKAGYLPKQEVTHDVTDNTFRVITSVRGGNYRMSPKFDSSVHDSAAMRKFLDHEMNAFLEEQKSRT